MIKSITNELKGIPQNQQLAQQQKGKKKSLVSLSPFSMIHELHPTPIIKI